MEKVLLNHTKKEYFFLGSNNVIDIINLIKMKNGWDISDDYDFINSNDKTHYLNKYNHITYNTNLIKQKLEHLIDLEKIKKSKSYYGDILICKSDKINLDNINYCPNQIISLCYSSNLSNSLIRIGIITPIFRTKIDNNNNNNNSFTIDLLNNKSFKNVINYINKLKNNNENDDKLNILINNETILFSNKNHKLKNFPKVIKTYKAIISLNAESKWFAYQIKIVNKIEK